MEIYTPTEARVIALARTDYLDAVGRIIEVWQISAFNSRTNAVASLQTTHREPPFRVRVLGAPLDHLDNWNVATDDYTDRVDPVWDVTPCTDEPRLHGYDTFSFFASSYAHNGTDPECVSYSVYRIMASAE